MVIRQMIPKMPDYFCRLIMMHAPNSDEVGNQSNVIRVSKARTSMHEFLIVGYWGILEHGF